MKQVILFGLLWAAIGLFGSARAVSAADFVVSDCGDNGGANQLRARINDAQASGGGTITFTCGPATITVNSQLPLITKPVAINGGNNITLSGGSNVRILFVNTNGELTLTNLTLTNGLAGNPGGAIYVTSSVLNALNVTIKNSTSTDEGGGLYANQAVVNLQDVTFDSNHAQTSGGGAYNSKSIFTFNNVTFNKNNADDNGGALVNDTGQVMWTDGAMTGNTAVNNGGGMHTSNADADPNHWSSLSHVLVDNNNVVDEFGGGLYVGKDATLAVDGSTISNSRTYRSGGGVFVLGGTLSVSNSTLNDNDARYGAGIFNRGSIAVVNTTISGNSAQYGGGIYNSNGAGTLTNVTFAGNGTTKDGGGIFQDGGTNQTLTLLNTIVADSPTGGNCYNEVGTISKIVSVGFNLSDDESCEDSFTYAGDKNGAQYDPMLGALAENGGLTKTHLPQTDSTAIDGGTNSGCPGADQRGVTRPQGGACDAGAVEVESGPACTGNPDKPDLIKPKNTRKAKGPYVALDWADTKCADTYDVIVRLGEPNGKKKFKAVDLPDSQVTTTKPLVKGQIYYWRVTAKNENGKSKSDWWWFKVK